ncbi:MAG: guanylate kinase [Thermomicrobiales bacterium]|nr:guanylate kinase [Thermomicrobiales bacterium]
MLVSELGEGHGDAIIAQLRNRRKPRMFVISGPSGVGKDSIIKILREVFPDVHVAVTATTRERRPGEAHGVDYFFYDTRYFEELRNAGEFLESAEVYGQWYGVPKHSVRHAVERGQDVFVKVDVQGAATIREQAPDAVFIFVSPASSTELLERLRARKTDEPEALMRRFREAEQELARATEFDYVVFNGQAEFGIPEQAVGEIQAIIEAERHRIHQPTIDL